MNNKRRNTKLLERKRIRLLIYKIWIFQEKGAKTRKSRDRVRCALVTTLLSAPKLPKSGGRENFFTKPPKKSMEFLGLLFLFGLFFATSIFPLVAPAWYFIISFLSTKHLCGSFTRGRIVGFRGIKSSHNAEKQRGTEIIPETHTSRLHWDLAGGNQ